MASTTVLRYVLFVLAAGVALAQNGGEESRNYRWVTLAEASARVQPDYRPKLLGELVRVKGIVQTTLLEASDASYLPILDTQNQSSGLVLLYSGDNKANRPSASEVGLGAVVEVSGIVSLHAGQAVVKPIELKVIGKAELPKPPVLNPLTASSFQYSGMLVEVDGEVAEFREVSWGDILEFKDGGHAIHVFLPMPGRAMERPLSAYQRGDKIRVKGVVTQFCLRPPYNQYFQLMMAGPREIELIEPRPALPPQIVPAAVVLVLLGILAAWYTQQRTRWHQRLIQKLMLTGEDLYSAGTAREVAELLRCRLIELTTAESVSVYHYDAGRKILDRIPDQVSSTQHSFHIDECTSAIERGIASCVKDKVLFQVSDTNACEVTQSKNEESRSLLVIPMHNRHEARGAIVITGAAGKQLLMPALHPAAQHLANDACQYFEGLELTALREQNHRSEKLAVAGQLIHGVITELNAPLEKIRDLTAALPATEAAAIHEQVKKASETVRRIVAVARAEQIDARPVDLRLLFQRLMETMEEGLRQTQIEAEINLGPESLYVLGSQEQLSRVFENLFQHASAAATYSLEHAFALNLTRIGRSAMIELEFSGPFGEGEGPDFSGSALGLAITRGLLQSYGGEVRFTTIRAGRYRYDVELPSLNASPSEEFSAALPFSPQRGMITALLVEPEMQSQRKMLAIFGELNHRLIPVSNIEEAADLAEKARFDIVFASARPDGGTWAELFHRIHHRTPHFVLLSESAEDQSAEILEGTASSMLRKPVEEADILGLITRMQQRG